MAIPAFAHKARTRQGAINAPRFLTVAIAKQQQNLHPSLGRAGRGLTKRHERDPTPPCPRTTSHTPSPGRDSFVGFHLILRRLPASGESGAALGGLCVKAGAF
jgi:hypothetical protein